MQAPAESFHRVAIARRKTSRVSRCVVCRYRGDKDAGETHLSFVFYDVETTGLNARFDQIVQFAAVKTDADLEVVDRFEIRSRLLPHVIPSPGALVVTGNTYASLIDPALPSHYEMVDRIRAQLADWCPATFLGFNSMRFDEEFLRHALYQCLHDAYPTNRNGSSRADILGLARVVAALRPDALLPHKTEEGELGFRLGDLAKANGIQPTSSHNAVADVETSLAICRKVKAGAPDLWDRFLHFSHKRAVFDFVGSEAAFLYFQPMGNHPRARVVMRIGEHHKFENIQFCLDLQSDVETLRPLALDELMKAFQKSPRPLVKVMANRAPMLCSLKEATEAQLDQESPDTVYERAETVAHDTAFMDRMLAAARIVETGYPRSNHVEGQLYDGFAEADVALMLNFHEAPWEERSKLADQIADNRYRNLARRLIYFERPDLLGDDERRAMDEEVARRVLGKSAVQGPWTTIPAAIDEVEKLLADQPTEDERTMLTAYRQALDECKARHESRFKPSAIF